MSWQKASYDSLTEEKLLYLEWELLFPTMPKWLLYTVELLLVPPPVSTNATERMTAAGIPYFAESSEAMALFFSKYLWVCAWLTVEVKLNTKLKITILKYFKGCFIIVGSEIMTANVPLQMLRA